MVFEKVSQIIANQLDLDPSEITMDSHLIKDLRADSLDIVELVMDMEQEFDVEIPDEGCPRCRPSATSCVTSKRNNERP